jgi:hypothetical protein
MMRRVVGALSLVGAAVAMPSSAGAQHLPARFASVSGTAAPASWALPRLDPESHRDFRWLGTAIGALGLGVAAGLEARAYCGNSEDGPRDCTGVTVGVGLLGAAAGGVLGHLVGRAIPRP